MRFLIDNILLIAIILVCIVALVWPVIAKRRYGPTLDSATATSLINRSNAQIVDLRDPAEFKKECIANSINIPATRIQNELGTLDKKRPVLLVDNDGRRARMVSPLLRGTGFAQVFILEGGLDAWRRNQMPFSR